MTAKTPRDLALDILKRQYYQRAPAERLLEQAFQSASSMSERDRAFTLHLVQGVLRYRLRLDWIVKRFLRFSFQKIEPTILNILRIALYQIFFMDRVPQSAAVNEAVLQVKAAGKGRFSGFANGLLRQVCRNKDQIVFPDKKNAPLHYLSVYYSFPEWLVRKWRQELGPDAVEPLLAAENRIPSLVIRVNRRKGDRDRLIAALREQGLSARATEYSPDGISLTGLKGPINDLRLFQQGRFQVQGEAAQVCAYLLNPRPGDTVLDVCAGLGGKSTHMAERMDGKGLLLSLDINYERLIRLSESAQRLGIGCIRCMVADAVHPAPLIPASFDKIMIDGPCSGLGVLSRHPDGKWIKEEKDIRRLARLQKRILDNAVLLLKPGGLMLYVTCTLSLPENEGVVPGFLKKNREMDQVDLRKHGPAWARPLLDGRGFLKTFPHIHAMDGFFAALFRKAFPG